MYFRIYIFVLIENSVYVKCQGMLINMNFITPPAVGEAESKNAPVSGFFFGFFLFFFGVESWAAAHGLYRCTEYRLLSEPMSTRLLNSISSRICLQNTQFNMNTTTSKQQEGCTFKDSHPKCFITTNFDKFHREAFARGGESR